MCLLCLINVVIDCSCDSFLAFAVNRQAPQCMVDLQTVPDSPSYESMVFSPKVNFTSAVSANLSARSSIWIVHRYLASVADESVPCTFFSGKIKTDYHGTSRCLSSCVCQENVKQEGSNDNLVGEIMSKQGSFADISSWN